jgi:hypothetical protein
MGGSLQPDQTQRFYWRLSYGMDMSTLRRSWHGSARPEIRRPKASHHQLSDLREQVESLLAWAEGTQEGPWRVADEERAFMASVSDLFGVPIPLGTFSSADGAAKFLRVVAQALQD